jgi:hypothetical protein
MKFLLLANLFIITVSAQVAIGGCGQMTYYNPGNDALGSCGNRYSDSVIHIHSTMNYVHEG